MGTEKGLTTEFQMERKKVLGWAHWTGLGSGHWTEMMWGTMWEKRWAVM